MYRRPGERRVIARNRKRAENGALCKHPGRKKKAGDCGRARCMMCHFGKFFDVPTAAQLRAPGVSDFN